MPPTPNQIRQALDRISTAAIADTRRLLNVADPRTALADIADFVAPYADGSSALAADYYDELRDAADVDVPYAATPIVDLDTERLRRAGLWAADPLYTSQPNLGLAVSRLSSVVQPAVVNPFRDTIVGNQQLDPAAVGYRRSASNGCKFCVMLAGRGAVYRNHPHFASHPHCRCTATPVFKGGDEGPEANVMQYTASQRRRTPAQQRALRRHLDGMPEPPRTPTVNPLQGELADAGDTAVATARSTTPRARRSKYTDADYDDVAATYGVTADEVRVARAEVAHLRKRLADEAAGQAAQSFAILDGADALAIHLPRAALRGGEFDWMERLNPHERARLLRRWLPGDDSTRVTIDEAAERLREMVPGLRNLGDDEVIRTVWLHHTRMIEGSGAIRRGRLPSLRQYSDGINARDFAPVLESEGYDVTLLLGDELDAAGHIAQVFRHQHADDAARVLDAYRTDLGPPPWEMSFQSWEAELRDLEYARDGLLGGNPHGLTDDQVRRRLAELLPPELDGEGFSYEDGYSAVITTARAAEYRVPAHAVIDWEA